MGQLSLCQFNNVEEKLFKALQSAGIHTSPQYPILGRRLDFAIVDKKIDIEVDWKSCWDCDFTSLQFTQSKTKTV